MVATVERSHSLLPILLFQSPFHRGNGCYAGTVNIAGQIQLSVPFSSGQWLLLTLEGGTPGIAGTSLSVPFSSGQWLLQFFCHEMLPVAMLSVPFSSGQWLLLNTVLDSVTMLSTFSPLFIGAMVATIYVRATAYQPDNVFQSPFHRGNGCYLACCRGDD